MMESLFHYISMVFLLHGNTSFRVFVLKMSYPQLTGYGLTMIKKNKECCPDSRGPLRSLKEINRKMIY